MLQFIKDNFIPRIPRDEPVPTLDEGPILQRLAALDIPELNGSFAAEKNKKDDISIHTKSTTSTAGGEQLHRKLKLFQIQIISVSGVIGSALFVAIGKVLAHGGPLSLLLAFIIWSFPILFITISTAEFVTYLPITSPFIRMAGRCCDEALQIMAAWNFWFLCCAQIPFEVVTVNSIIHFWRDDYSPAITLSIQVFLYFGINLFSISFYGYIEFYLGITKVVLAIGLIFYAFVTMVGGNPKHDAYGFRYWRDPGPFSEYIATGNLGRFEGFLYCLIQACFTFAGPEYLSSVASETRNPRKVLPSAFKQVFYRLSVFFIGGALAVGVVIPSNDPTLLATLGASKPGAGSSPYVISMQNLGIRVLPDIINVLLVISSFSAGNSYTYCSSRTLYGFALEGYGPKFLTATTRSGVPLYCVLISLAWAFLSFLQLGSGSAQVLNWIINLITSCQLLNFSILCLTYICFYYALKAQGIDRDSLPFKGWYQPWLAIIGLVLSFSMIFVATYTIFLPGNWDYQSFLFSYLMLFIDLAVFVGYKLIKRTKWRKSADIDLVSGLREVELHEADYYAKIRDEGKLDQPRKWYQKVGTVLVGTE